MDHYDGFFSQNIIDPLVPVAYLRPLAQEGLMVSNLHNHVGHETVSATGRCLKRKREAAISDRTMRYDGFLQVYVSGLSFRPNLVM